MPSTRARPCSRTRRCATRSTYLFDFEWTNKNLFYDAYTRSRSYFSNSELAATGTPSADELKLLEPFKGQIPDEVFTKQYDPPKTDGSGNIRDNLRTALKLLGEAGWSVKGRQAGQRRNGEPFQFEFLLSQDQADFERVVLPFAQNLKRIGIDMAVRTVDPAQYENRMQTFDYDMTVDRASANRCRPAMSSANTGPAPRPTRRAARTTWASRARRSMLWSTT